jgi:acyl-ACP thioesterase
VEKLFAMRDFRVSDEEGRELGIASTAWLILNTKSRRPQRPFQELEEYRSRNNPVYESTMQKLLLPDKLEKLVNRPVVWSDLDIVGHVNNVKYMEWCIDALVGGMITEEEIRHFEINFLSESVLGDVIEIFASPEEDRKILLSGRGVRDDSEKFRVALEWDYKEDAS